MLTQNNLKFLLFFFNIIDNKRLDEWVTEDRLDMRKVQYPRKDGSSASVAGFSTPKRVQASTSVASSRPSSPIVVPEVTNEVPILNQAFHQIDQQKKIVRRKKLNFNAEAEVTFIKL